MKSKLTQSSCADGQYTRRRLLNSALGIAAMLFVFVGHSPAGAEEGPEPGVDASSSVGAVEGFSAWEIQPDSTLSEIYGLGAEITTPEVNSELAIILWDEARNNERRPVRSVSDEGNGNIQGNQLRMLSR